MNDNNFVLFSGYARLPKGTSSSNMHETMAMVVLIDLDSETIVEAECTLSTPTSDRYVASLLVGQSIAGGVVGLCRKLERCYGGNAQKSITTALHSIYNNYRSYRKQLITTG